MQFKISASSATGTTKGATTGLSTIGPNLGKVSNCTLSNAKQINVENNKYCAVDQGYKTQSQATAHCITLNARLPLPKSKWEYIAFKKEFSSNTWIDITDPGSGSRFPILLDP